MKQFFLKLFTWWNGQTFGTQLWTWRFGELVGTDESGNRYYRTRGGKIDPTLHFERRWVVYNGYAEATKIPPSWHGWIHHTVDVPPTEEKYQPREWEKSHQPNLTGTATYDPNSLADGAGETTTVTVTGAALGDQVDVSFSLDLSGVIMFGWVSATNTVSVRFQNESGTLVDLGSGTITAVIRRAS